MLKTITALLFAAALMIPADGARADGAFLDQLLQTAKQRTGVAVRYDGAYRAIGYPLGDVPDDVGVCTDVIVRSYRGAGVDLQQRVHEDMRTAFGEYPALWGLRRPDANIDHRRVPNLQAFFTRHGASFAVSEDANAYQPGDIVTWMLPGNRPHIGIISDRVAASGTRAVIHNIGAGPVEDDSLFAFPITGHYRYSEQ